MRLDEHTETTLARIARSEPVTEAALDAAAQVLVGRWTDPGNPENWLRRPAWRICFNCGRRYSSRIAVLAAPIYCSNRCRGEAEAKARSSGVIL